jgi:hypothetical protein
VDDDQVALAAEELQEADGASGGGESVVLHRLGLNAPLDVAHTLGEGAMRLR